MILSLALGAALIAPVDASFACCTLGFSVEQQKYGPSPPILEARQEGAMPPP